jgi:hypothetical protein
VSELSCEENSWTLAFCIILKKAVSVLDLAVKRTARPQDAALAGIFFFRRCFRLGCLSNSYTSGYGTSWPFWRFPLF